VPVATRPSSHPFEWEESRERAALQLAEDLLDPHEIAANRVAELEPDARVGTLGRRSPGSWRAEAR